MSKPKPLTRTFRIEAVYDEALREDAEKRGISVNNLMNHILKEFSESLRFKDKGNSITLAPQTLQNLIMNLTGEELEKAGLLSGKTRAKDNLLMRGKMLQRENILWYISEILGEYSDWFTCDIYERKDHTLIFLRHIYDEKWSKFLSSFLNEMFIETLDIDSEIEYSESSVTIKLPK